MTDPEDIRGISADRSPDTRYEHGVYTQTGRQLIARGTFLLLAFLIPSILIAGASAPEGSIGGMIFAGILNVIGVVVGGATVVMGLIKYAREVWRS